MSLATDFVGVVVRNNVNFIEETLVVASVSDKGSVVATLVFG